MKLKINTISLSILIIVFTFKSHSIFGQTDGNETETKIISESKPLSNNETVRQPRETRVLKSLNSLSETRGHSVRDLKSLENKNDTSSESLENDNSDIEDVSWSSSSSEESSLAIVTSTIRTTRKPTSKRSYAAVAGKSKKLTRSDTVRLIKPRKGQQGDNWYAKRDATENENAGVNTTKQTKQKRQKQGGFYEGDAKKVAKGGVAQGGRNKPISGSPAHIKHGAAHVKPPKSQESGGGAQNLVDPLINRTSKHPFSVERAKTRPVDPLVYSFFQYKPSQSIGYLWTQKAGLGGRGETGKNETEPITRPDGNNNGADEDHLDPANKYDWEFKRYDRACLYVEYLQNMAQMNASQVTEETSRIVDNQNEQIARRFLDWQFINKEDHETIALKGQGEKHPQYLTFKFLTMTVEIFRDKICRNATPYAATPEIKHFAPASAPMKAEANKKYLDTKFLPKGFIDDLYRLFLALRDITLPKGVPDYPTKRDEEDILQGVLEKCLKMDPVQWFSHTCADQVLSYDDPHNYACTPLIDYDFNSKEYDPIVDGMWHMFTAVHSFCYDEFNKISTRLWHKYGMIIANSFTEGMRRRWKASIAEPKFYVRLLGPDHTTHLETMNRCMFAATLRSGAPYVLPRFLTSSPISFGRDRTLGKDASEIN